MEKGQAGLEVNQKNAQEEVDNDSWMQPTLT